MSTAALFQSSPGPKTGCDTDTVAPTATTAKVSILTRPEDRVRHTNGDTLPRLSHMFQSSPGPKTGCDGFIVTCFETLKMFQSSPGPKTGCDIPISRGGSNDQANLATACRSCNSAKGARTPDEWKGAR